MVHSGGHACKSNSPVRSRLKLLKRHSPLTVHASPHTHHQCWEFFSDFRICLNSASLPFSSQCLVELLWMRWRFWKTYVTLALSAYETFTILQLLSISSWSCEFTTWKACDSHVIVHLSCPKLCIVSEWDWSCNLASTVYRASYRGGGALEFSPPRESFPPPQKSELLKY